MATHHDEDLQATKTEGYKAGEKKTIAEYEKLGEFLSCCCGPSSILPELHRHALGPGYMQCGRTTLRGNSIYLDARA